MTDAVQKDKEAGEKEVAMEMDSDANLPTSSDEDEDVDSADEEDGSTKPMNVKR